MLVSFDAWLRISEVAGLRARDVVDTRDHADEVMHGVSVFLPKTKTGRRQAVRIEDPAVADLLVAWRDACGARHGENAQLFPDPPDLRAALARSLGLFRVDAHGLAFTWHSFRHGGASRAYLSGMMMADVLLRGRWKVESSGRHYVQSGRQLLLTLALPLEVTTLAGQIARVGLRQLFADDLAARLDS